MRKTMILVLIGATVATSGCNLVRRKGGEEFAVAKSAPLVVPPDFGPAFREMYAGKADTPFVITVRRGTETLKLDAKIELGNVKVEADPNSNEKATRIRDGILSGATGS